jgi:ABC-type Fe3+ transport system permease subunit
VVWSEIIVGALLVLLLVGLSLYFGRHQVVALRKLRETPDLPVEEMTYERRKAHRRLVSCALMMILAILLAVLLSFADPTQRLADAQEAFRREYSDEEKLLMRIWAGTLIAALLVLLIVLVLAGIDLLSTRRYGLTQYRKLQADRRAMIERQANRMRRDRNGHA